MVLVQLQAQLGNQMFQYAAGLALAKRLGTGLTVYGKTNLLGQAFGLGLGKFQSRLLYHLTPSISNALGFTPYSPRYEHYRDDVVGEVFDETWWDIRSRHVLLRGWFQSELYFREAMREIRDAFQPNQQILLNARNTLAQISIDSNRLCGIHLRFGDYYTSDMGLAHPILGWVLPPSYYKSAVDVLPRGLTHVVTSDMPDRAEALLSWLPNKVIMRNNSPLIDMLVLTQCRYIVISNSTFAWWAAWLGQSKDRVVLCPRYWIGWWRQVWFPNQIRPEGWVDIPVPLPLSDCCLTLGVRDSTL